MARDEQIDARLWRWAEWLKTGDGSGYPVKSTLHEDWCPPSPGMRPGIKVAPHNDAPQTHRFVLRLSETLRGTLAGHYLMRMNALDLAACVACQPATVHARIETAHRAIAGMLEADRVGVLQHRQMRVDSGTLV
jgi:hypothetical protein